MKENENKINNRQKMAAWLRNEMKAICLLNTKASANGGIM